MINFLKYQASGDYTTAARFLQLPPGENLEQLVGYRAVIPGLPGQHQLAQR